MFNNERIRPLLFLFLVFCVLSSKHIIIYNEETLVALSFLAFVFFISHYFGTTIQESLSERSETIKSELQNFLTLKQESLQELLKEHHRISHLKATFDGLSSFTQKELLPIGKSSAASCHRLISQQIEQKLQTLAFSRSALQQRLQQLMAKNILSLVLVQIGRLEKKSKGGHRGPQLHPKAIRNSIELLKSGQKAK